MPLKPRSHWLPTYRLKVIVTGRESGKGGAVLEGISQAAEARFTHALTMDSDGQHPADFDPKIYGKFWAEPQKWCQQTRV